MLHVSVAGDLDIALAFSEGAECATVSFPEFYDLLEQGAVRG